MSDKFNIINFLEEYQRYPCLWDKSLSDHKNKNMRDAAEESIRNLFKIETIKELRQKIRSLRCSYNQEKAKIKSSMGTGTGANSVYTPKLAWFSFADSFLNKNYEDNKAAETNLIMNVNENIATSQEDFTQNTSIQSNLDADTTLQKNETFKTSKRTASTISYKANKKQKINSSLDNAVEALKFACSQKSAVSEFNIFCQHVATQLEKLPIRVALELQMKIQNMITNARLGIMDDMHSNSGPSENSQDMFGQSNEALNEQDTTENLIGSEDEGVITLYYNNWENK